MRLSLVARTGHPDLFGLPWEQPLEAWDGDFVTDVPRGLHRHVVRAVTIDDELLILKELPRRLAQREYRLLGELDRRGVPVVEVVGVVLDRRDAAGEPLPAVLITEHLPYSLPYRLLFARESQRALREPMLDALVDLLVRIHLVGFFWGDCSLSNTLFRRDAGRLAAYVVDVETGEMHEQLSEGQRAYDIALAIERCGGELMDLQAAGLVTADVDPLDLADELRARYEGLWAELTHEQVFRRDEGYRIDERLRRINELGYDVNEIELVGQEDEVRLRLSTGVVEPGRHARQLQILTGLDVQERQARRLLNDIHHHGAWLARERGVELPEQVVAARWLESAYGPTIAVIPEELRDRREAPELYHEVLEHRYYLSEAAGQDIGLEAAARSYVEKVLRHREVERAITLDDAAVGLDLDDDDVDDEPTDDEAE